MKEPRPHQQNAINDGLKYFSTNNRGKLIMPCGSGKTLTALWLSQRLNCRNMIVVLPNLVLENQIVDSWINDIEESGLKSAILVLGSDKSLGRRHESVTLTTSESDVDKFLLANHNRGPIVVFTTYHSSKLLAECVSKIGVVFDLAIFDEAHHTAGVEKALFQSLVTNDIIFIKKRLFMTATPKVLIGQGNNQYIKSMDDPSFYGKEFYRLTVRDAIEQGIICDYKLVTLYSEEQDIIKMVRENININDLKNDIDNEVRYVAVAISLFKSIEKYGIRKIISYHNSINRAKVFESIILKVALMLDTKIDIFHINHTTRNRESIVSDFKKSDCAIITNSRLLNEGFDLPAVDAVLFADKRDSVVDIVQASGRAWRLDNNKQFGYILVPIISHREVDFEDNEFTSLRRILASLSGMDEKVAAYFRNPERARRSNNNSVIQEFVSKTFDTEALVANIEVKVWSQIRSLYYLSYDEASEWCRENLVRHGIIDSRTWRDFITQKIDFSAPQLPADIPRRPEYAYKEEWVSYRHFLGTEYWTYEQSSRWNKANLPAFRNIQEYQKLWREGKWGELSFPENIPSYWYYKIKLKEKAKVSDYINMKPRTQKRRNNVTFADQKKWIKKNLSKFGVDSKTKWKQYLKGGFLNAPELPENYYKNLEKMPDWAGWTELFDKVAKLSKDRKYNYEESKIWVRKNLLPLGVNSSDTWRSYLKGEISKAPKLPDKFLSAPSRYVEWVNWKKYFYD